MHMLARTGLVVVALMLGAGPVVAAADVVAVVANKSSITRLTPRQVEDIFLGRINHLESTATLVPLDLPEGSPARAEFYATFGGKSAAQLKAHWSRLIFTGRGQPPAVVSDIETARKRVATNPNAIAYMDRSAVDASIRIVAP